MDLQNLNLIELVPSNLIVLVAVLYVLGTGLKKAQAIPDKYITVILLVLGITLAILLSMINAQYKTAYEAAINGFMQGIICWGIAIGINQTAKQLNK